MIELTILLENSKPENSPLAAEHGLSILVETPRKKFIFDTGQSDLTWKNAARLGIDLASIDFVVLSHSHYDHAGGFKTMPVKPKTLYVGKGFWNEKFSRVDGGYKYRGAGFSANDLEPWNVRQKVCGNRLELDDDAWLIGNFVKKYPFETIPPKFVCGVDKHPDAFDDEICLALRGADGLTLIVGCSHVGILNIVSTVRNRLNYPVSEVIGGIHLSAASDERRAATINELKNLGVKRLNLCHCSGVSNVATGSKIKIGVNVI